jgi:hypothetical protein
MYNDDEDDDGEQNAPEEASFVSSTIDVRVNKLQEQRVAMKTKMLSFLSPFPRWKNDSIKTADERYKFAKFLADFGEEDIMTSLSILSADVAREGIPPQYTLPTDWNLSMDIFNEFSPTRYAVVYVRVFESPQMGVMLYDNAFNAIVYFMIGMSSEKSQCVRKIAICPMHGYFERPFETIYAYYIALSKKYITTEKAESKIDIGLIVQDRDGYTVQMFKIPKPEVNIIENYGSEFHATHYPRIVNKLKTLPRGVYIFESQPGCGKTYFIKHLISEIGKNRTFLYLSDAVINSGFDSPALIQTMARYPNCVVIIEDGEKYMTDREKDANSLVSGLLNVADGILGDILGFSLIITHNQKNVDIDTALTRKGRIHYQYQFNALSVADAQRKIDAIGKNYKVTKPMTLAEIYNLECEVGDAKPVEKPRMGF